MPSELSWFIQDRVFYLRLFDEITFEEMQQTNQQGIEMLEAGTAPVHVIMDDEDLKKAPVNLSQVTGTLKIYRHAALGWIVVIGESKTIGKYISSLMAQLFRVQYQRSPTIQGALDFLHEQDGTLDWSKADYSVLSQRENS